MKTYNQVILNKAGNSWLNIHIQSEKMNSTLAELLRIVTYYKEYPEQTKAGWQNQVWVIDFDGTVRAAQRTLELALRYYKENQSILVHANNSFF